MDWKTRNMSNDVPYYEREGWVRIKGFPNNFVNRKGEIASYQWSNQFKKKKKFLVMKQGVNPVSGYKQITLRSPGKKPGWTTVHKLVLETFHGPKPRGMEARHGVGGKHNNSAKNLCWGTHKDNVKDKLRDGITVRGSKNPMAKLNEDQVEFIRYLNGYVTHTYLAKLFNVSRPEISLIQGGQNWTFLTT